MSKHLLAGSIDGLAPSSGIRIEESATGLVSIRAWDDTKSVEVLITSDSLIKWLAMQMAKKETAH